MPVPSRTRTPKFTAVVAFVVLGPTGFSRGGMTAATTRAAAGGGCGSPRQDHDADHFGHDDDEEDFGDDGSGTGDDVTPTPDASTDAVRGYGAVDPTDREDTFTARVNFVAGDDLTISIGGTDVTLPAHGTKTVKVPSGEDADLDALDHCEAQPDAYPVD
ncbi:hypothetical protein FRZ03_19775 [Streptomyces misionensis]|uniref:Uncharacterized protein n=1 Tax=Streptomyces misionensis TaxID=67331 RepID=A0A5C6JM75_9ACTN|nr:hypothetical protein [Streptomyces misionensis]TWV42524.1 hypothetical protein FRZ03_19775 [Streptomyces misionensis]